MTVGELHIRVNQRYQEVASNKRDTFFPEEIDLALNTAQDRFIISKVEAFLQDNQTDLASVAPLVTKNGILPIIIPAEDSTNIYEAPYEPNMVYSVLPGNLKFLLNSRAEIITNTDGCGGTPSLATTLVSEFMAATVFPTSNSAPFYPAFAITGPVTFNVSGTSYNSGFSSNKGKYRLVGGAMSFFDTSVPKQHGFDLNVYWERYRGRYFKDTFIFVSPINPGTYQVAVTGSTITVAPTQFNYTTYNRSLISSLPTLTRTIVDTRPTESGLLYTIQTKNKYYRSRPTDPIVHQTQDYLFAYIDESFLVTRQYIDYVRKPREISLALNTSCELETAIPEIIDLAVEILRLDTKDRNYTQTVQDTELRNKL